MEGGVGKTQRKRSIITVIVMLTTWGCHNVKEPASKLEMADPSTSSQLLSGFWWPESNAWRWTARQFSAALRPPDDAESRGATLHLHLFVPDSQIESLGPLTLRASVEGRALPPETFSKSGPYTYTREIPKELMATNILPVKFSFDKAMPPANTDGRELAAVVTGIELETN